MDLKRADIIAAFKKAKGRVTHACKLLGVCHDTVYSRMKEDPSLKEALTKERAKFYEELLDAAEDTLAYTIAKRDEDRASGLKSAMYTLNNKGRKRGWNPPQKNDSYSDDEKASFDRIMTQISQSQSIVAKLKAVNPELLIELQSSDDIQADNQ